MNLCIIILGMHRSGTSATTGILSFFDAFLGDELIEPNDENPKGFFENRKILDLNKAILKQQQSNWDDYHFNFNNITTNDFNQWVDEAKNILIDEFQYVNAFVIKDPRLCLLFPIWEAALTALNVKIKIISPHRSPLEVAHSLKHRNGFSIEKGLLLWSSYTFSLEKFSRQQDRLPIIFPDDFYEPHKIVNQIKDFTQLSISEARLEQAYSFYEPKLNHQHFPPKLISSKVPSYIHKTINAIQNKDFDNNALFDSLNEDYQKSLSIFNTTEIFHSIAENPLLKNEIQSLKDETQSLKNEIQSLKNEIQSLKNEIQTLNQQIQNTNKEQKKTTNLLHNEILNFKQTINIFSNTTSKLKLSSLNKKGIKSRFKSIYTHKKNQVLIQHITSSEHKIKEIGLDNIGRFSEKAYLDSNKDIEKSISQGNFNSALEHYIYFGYEEIQQGKRKPILNAQGYQELHLKITKNARECAQQNKPLCQKFYDEISSRPNVTLPPLSNEPDNTQTLVSIIVLNRNGLHHLEKLFIAIARNTKNIPYEIIVVDNASSDNSVQYLQKNDLKLPLKIITNQTNESFSLANNKAVEIAQGEYILLANNDIEPLKNWLAELLNIAQREENVGSVGAKLIYPYRASFAYSCQIQHAGIAFKNEGDFFRPYNMGNDCRYDDKKYALSQKRAAVTAACLLVKKDIYLEAGGLDEAYNYGYEDVDFGLKLLKQGYNNYYTPNATAFHYEFGTQETDDNDKVTSRRQKNIDIFRHKWFHFLKQSYWEEKLIQDSSSPLIFTESPMTVAIAVTDSGENVSAGDYFTAQELASALETFGWNIVYLSKIKEEWYTLPEKVDILITLLDAYDLQQLPNREKPLTTIAWTRNWFDKWSENSSFNDYDIVCASSLQACDYLQKHSQQTAYLLPIASNPKRFLEKPHYLNNKKYQCDICFTGSYWNNERDIMNCLSDDILSRYNTHIYGANWEQFEKFKPHYKGFINYEEMPFVYHNAKIAIDDANHVTKPYGSVNSRVFDALLSGTLVITNGALGSQDLFNGELPYYETQEQLDKLLNHYLNNDEAREEKIKALKSFVLKYHTYQHRADELHNLLKKKQTQTSISLKIPAPNWKVCHQWGDYHMGVLLKEQLEKLNYTVHLHMLEQWQSKAANSCDISLVFRGLSRHTVQPHQLNLMWNISHPDKVTLEEYDEYDHVFIASNYWTEQIKKQINTPVTSLLQCTDPKRFKPLSTKETDVIQHQLLFVGNSRKIHRQIIKDVLPTEYDLSVYGADWKGLIDDKYIKGSYINNEQLYQYYASATILLNDHWDDMQEKGFISNRLYDALACGAFIVSDKVKDMGDIASYIKTYSNKTDLAKIIKQRIENPEKDQEMTLAGMNYVIKNHTFSSRAATISEKIKYYKETAP